MDFKVSRFWRQINRSTRYFCNDRLLTVGTQPVIAKHLVWLKSISRQRWGMHFEEKAKQIASAQLPPSWGGWHRSWVAFKLLCARSKHRSSVQLLASIRSSNWQEAACQLEAALQLGCTCLFSETAVRNTQDCLGFEGRMRQEYFLALCEVTHQISIANWLLWVL